MKIPKIKKRYCNKCRKHTAHNVIEVKRSGKRGKLKIGERRHSRRGGIKGYGGFPHPQQQKSHRHKIKTSKKIDLRMECSECRKKSVYKSTFRTKKFEIKRAQ